MNPSNKSAEIETYLENLSGCDRRSSIKKDVCIAPPIGCGKPVSSFRDKISEKEFTISGLCQNCQDHIWGITPNK